MALTLLTNITVVDADLAKLEPRLSKYLFAGSENFNDQIAIADRTVYREVKGYLRGLYPTYTNAELETAMGKLKDLTGEYLKDAVIFKSLELIYTGNDIGTKADYYSGKYEGADLKGYVDDNSDSVVGDTELLDHERPILTRA